MWLSNLQLVLPDETIAHGSLHIVGQQIAEIRADAAPPGAAVVIDGTGLIALPGLIDMHGDMLEFEVEPRPGAAFPIDMAIFELDKRLAATGITTAYAALSFWEIEPGEKRRSIQRAQQLVQAIHAQRHELLVDLRVHARYEVTTPVVASTLARLLQDGQIHMLSLMDHTPGQGQYRNLEHYVSFMSKWRNSSPAEVEAEARQRLQQAQRAPEIWQQAADLVALAQAQHLPIASHDDDTAAKIDLMATFGVAISEFPVTLEAASEARSRGLAVAMGAPNVLRGLSHSGNLSATEAIQAGVVDMLAADYAPAALIQAIFVLVRQGILPLHAAARLVGQNVAAALGLHDRGRLAEGLAADITLVEPAARPRVRATIRNGVPIYWDAAMAERMTRQ
jgi:alpha-D-ribose 1-methylphosphonate 5-triphosphate diphosphatase